MKQGKDATDMKNNFERVLTANKNEVEWKLSDMEALLQTRVSEEKLNCCRRNIEQQRK